ncbi:MAG: glycosyltransferase family 4 protein, partial [Myxococcaceae bacterium]
MRYPAAALSDLPRALLCSFDVIPGPTGSSRRLTEYLRELSEHFSVVVLSAKTPDHSHIQRFHGARLLRVPVGSGDLPSRVQAFDRAVRRQLDSEEYVVAHFTDPFGGYALCELRETYGYRLIYEAHGFPSQELASQDPQMESDRRFLARARRQELFCLMNADRVITGSEVTRAFIHGLGVSEDIVDVLRAPVDVAAISAETGTEPVGSPMRVLYLGSQVEWQGLPTLLRAVKQVLREVELQLTIAGPAHVREQPLLEDLIRDLGIGRNVVLQPPPPPEELPRLLGSADVGVVPLIDVHRNRVQGGPLTKVAEYLAAGRPVLASDLPVTRELIPSGAGLFHPPGNVDALAANLIRLARAPQSRVQMGAAARKAARAFHDATAIRRRLAGIYSRLLGTVREDTSASGAEPFPPAMRAALKSATDADIEGTDPAIAPRLLATREQNGPQEPGTSSTEPSAKSPDDVVRVVALSPLLPLPGDAPESTSTEVLPPPPMPPVPSAIPTNRSDHLIGRRGAEPEASSTPIVGPPSTPGTPGTPGTPTRSTVPTFIPRRIPPGRPTTLIPVTPPVLSPSAVPSSEPPAPPAPTRVT